jgi:hypothetical protein
VMFHMLQIRELAAGALYVSNRVNSSVNMVMIGRFSPKGCDMGDLKLNQLEWEDSQKFKLWL